MYEAMRDVSEVAPLFLKRPHRSLATAGQLVWVKDDDFDIEHHVRHAALPRPGRARADGRTGPRPLRFPPSPAMEAPCSRGAS